MRRILYISTARSPLTNDDLQALLSGSRHRNAANDITGLLLVGGKRFLQVLEGPSDAVSETYDRIAKDPRHFALVKLNDKLIDARSFGQWAMGFEQGGLAKAEATLEDQVSAIVAPLKDRNLQAYFLGFAKSHSSASLS